MPWVEKAKLKGPAGPQGDPGPVGPQGPAAPKYFGVLRWSGAEYKPPSGFRRLITDANEKMVVYADAGGVAFTSVNSPRLYAPVSGIYTLSATQTWAVAAVNKSIGLGRSQTDALAGMELWADFNTVQRGIVTRTTYLEAGTTLYPWFYTANATTTMMPSDRGLAAEYSMTLVQAQ